MQQQHFNQYIKIIYTGNVARLFYSLFYCDGRKFNLTGGFLYFSVHSDRQRNIYLQRWLTINMYVNFQNIYTNTTIALFKLLFLIFKVKKTKCSSLYLRVQERTVFANAINTLLLAFFHSYLFQKLV